MSSFFAANIMFTVSSDDYRLYCFTEMVFERFKYLEAKVFASG